jgi:phage shock protein C
MNIVQLSERAKQTLEQSAFGVCSFLGERIHVPTSRVRLYFIYLSFAALGSPILVYLFIAFWLNINRYIKQYRNFIQSE